MFCDQLRGASRRTQGCRLRLSLVHRSVAPFEFLYSPVSALNPMTWIVITTSSDCESCFATAASGRFRRAPSMHSGLSRPHPRGIAGTGFTAVIVLILTTTDTDSLSSRLSSYAPSIFIASRTVSWLRPFLDEDPFGLFAADFLPCDVLSCSWLCSSCLPLALPLLPAVDPLFPAAVAFLCQL